MEKKQIIWPLIEGSHIVYSEFIDVEVDKAPYYNIQGSSRFFLKRRKGYKIADFTLANWSKPTIWGKITDKIIFKEVPYFMWISDDKKTIRIYQLNGCELKMVKEDCYCGEFDKFIVTYLPAWEKATLFQWSTTSTTWIQQNQSVVPWLLEWYFSDDAVSYSNPRNFNNGTWSIKPWDYIYIYKADEWANCWQINQVAWKDWDRLIMQNPRTWFEAGTLGTVVKTYTYTDGNWVVQTYPYLTQDYLIQPQTEWKYVSYVVFSKLDEVIGYPSCEWMKFLLDWTQWFKNCFLDACQYFAGVYDSAFGRMLYGYNPFTWALTYSQPWIWQNQAEDFADIWMWVIGMDTFQNYIAYFGRNFIWWAYITRDEKLGTYYSIFNRTRKNLWIRQNSNGRWEAYTQFSFDVTWQAKDAPDSMFFVWSNKHIYTLSIIPDGTGKLTFRTTDLTDNGFCAQILWDLENIRKGDDVYLSWDDDVFRIIINHKKSAKTKILIFNKRYKIWIKHFVCCAKLNKYIEWDWIWPEGIYRYCGDKDCAISVIEWRIIRYVWDDVSWIPWQTVLDSFTTKQLDFLQLQLWNESNLDGKAILSVTSERWLYRPTLTLWGFDKSWYLQSLENIRNWNNTFVPKCNMIRKSSCESFNDPCEHSVFWPEEVLDCECPEEFYYEKCLCEENKKHHLASFVNHHIKFPQDTTGKTFKFEFAFTNQIQFWGFFGRLDIETEIKYDECAFIQCDCKEWDDCHKKDERLTTCS